MDKSKNQKNSKEREKKDFYLALTMRVAKVNGTDTRQNMIMVIAKLALKMKI